MKTIADVMTSPPITVPENATVRDALGLLETLEIRHLPVIDAHHALLGVVSERDLHSFYAPRQELAVAAVEQTRAALDRPVSRVMVKDALFIGPDASLAEGAKRLVEGRVSALPVLRDGVVVGIVSYVDLLRALAR